MKETEKELDYYKNKLNNALKLVKHKIRYNEKHNLKISDLLDIEEKLK
ncbi:MAG: hypothetical protein ACE5ES_06075 [Candidatus Nanoarchaeia archaeon]